MAQLFLWTSNIIAVIVIILTIKIRKIKHELTKIIQCLYTCAIACILLNAADVLPIGETGSVLLHGLYLAATDWLVIVLMVYARRYVRINFGKKLTIAFCVLALADTISLVVNTFTRHIFDSQSASIGNTNIFVARMKFPMYITHLAVAYLPVIIVLVIFGYKVFRTTKMYRTKYQSVFVSLILIVAANIGYRFLKTPIDISPILYAFMAISICYFTLYYVPRGLVAKLLSHTLNDMDNGIMCFDREGKCVYVNAVIKRLFNTGDDLSKIEKNYEAWKNGRKPEELTEESWRDDKMLNGEMNYFYTTFKPLLDENGNHVGAFFVSENHTRDILELKKQQYRALHDKLTGIYNREGFIERVSRTLEQNPEADYTMLCTDIKDFKLVNELFGEKRGDEILMQIADLLLKNTSRGTIYGRLGTDRFAIFMRTELYHEEMFVEYAKQLSKLASNDVYHMVIHVGVYKNVNKQHSVATMCDHALLAINKIKDDYQQIVSYYDEALSQNIKNENQLIGEFDKALTNGEFCMFLQAQVSREHVVQGAEALTRWMHPDVGMIPPVSFIPLFERISLIHKLDMYIWEQACIKLKEWKEQGKTDMYISVNISPKDFYLVDIYATFTMLVKKYDINPANLRLEITETALMADINKQIELIEKLRAFGFAVEIDDFGSGYSSLNTLKDIHADVLKLDMGFLSQTEFKDRSNAVIDAVVTLSKQLGLSVISEGVETSEQVDFLTKTGCDVFQGYYFARPMPVKDFEEKYMNNVVSE
ncbi:MAG: EAL domain-containing protein [Lachnospiraceae bacterium]|nr:EAL domain-containing protein [Lachnospiraceae bacterium]